MRLSDCSVSAATRHAGERHAEGCMPRGGKSAEHSPFMGMIDRHACLAHGFCHSPGHELHACASVSPRAWHACTKGALHPRCNDTSWLTWGARCERACRMLAGPQARPHRGGAGRRAAVPAPRARPRGRPLRRCPARHAPRRRRPQGPLPVIAALSSSCALNVQCSPLMRREHL